jgi:hypothetical protein
MEFQMSRAFTGIATALVSTFVFGANPSFPVMAWGIRPTEQASPFVNELRYGCHAEPAECVERYKPTGSVRAIAIAFAQAVEPRQNIEKAKLFSELSVAHPVLKEIGVDDLFSFMKKLDVDDKGRYLEGLVDATKSSNQSLQFGITLYENEISSISDSETSFPKRVREKIDRVAFYLHYRKNFDKYEDYVNRLRALFPNAAIYGGVYHYDRVDYIGCSQKLPIKCTEDAEVTLYKETLELQVSLMKSKKLDGLEFYPGFLGNEDSWPAWSKRKICSESRRRKCVENTKEMTRETLQLLGRP